MPANHGRSAWIYTSTFGGGLVDGDDLAVRVEVGCGASAFLSTQASTKVYRSQTGSISEMAAAVDRQGSLVIVPDPVVCFAGSRYRQTQRFVLSDEASLVLVDWVSSGRRAAGERWAFAEYVSRTFVRYNGRLVMHDTVALRQTDGDLAERLGRFDVLALIVLIGGAVRNVAANAMCEIRQQPIARRADELISAAELGEVGTVIRVAGRSVEQVGRRVRGLLECVPAILGDDPWSRKW
jgi:urease accessory protein